MSQESLPFFDSDKAATRHAIEASRKAIKDVANALWPQKQVERAASDLRAALNENRPEQLSSDEHAFVANYCKRFDWLYYVAHQCSHGRPEPVTPAEIAAHLQQELFKTAGQMRALLDRIDRLQGGTTN